jgi:hypothetical protein
MRPSPLSRLTAGLILAFLPFCASKINAQGPPPRQSLLLQEAVQADLGLSDKQKSQINSLQANAGQKSRDAFQALQESGADPQEFQETMSALQREHQASLNRVLDKDQKARMAQIELQREGFLAASRSAIATKLKLTPTQTKKIKTIVDELRQAQTRSAFTGPQTDAAPATSRSGTSKAKKGSAKARRPSGGNGGLGNDELGMDGDLGGDFGGGGFFGGFPQGAVPPGGQPDFLKPENQPDFQRMQEAQQKAREAASTKIGEVLTADQKEAFEKLTGKKFDFAKLETTSTQDKAADSAEPRADDAMKKEATPPAKTQSKTKKKTGGN